MIRQIVLAAAFTALLFGLAGAGVGGVQDRADGSGDAGARNPFEGDKEAISQGGALFRARCGGCHGPDARGYLGPDITGFWVEGGSDRRMFDIVRRGVPGTEMTAADSARISDKVLWQILTYLRTLSAAPAAVPIGDAANGERIFRAQCSSCHILNGRGGLLGPDLSRIGSGRPRAGLLHKLRGTSTFVRSDYRSVTLVTRDGQTVRGIRKNEDEFSIQIMDTRERLQGYRKADLVELRVDRTSLMPVYGRERLNDREADDLLHFLTKLRGSDAVQ